MNQNFDQSVCDAFEDGFMRIEIDQRLQRCDRSELTPYFESLLPDHQPILEGGSGSGVWVAWFSQKGWRTVGLDWSSKLCARAAAGVPGAGFASGDLRCLPFPDRTFGSIVALGSIEHVAEGPSKILDEFYRVLGTPGIAVITVPYYGALRRIIGWLGAPLQILRNSPIIRKLAGKPTLNGGTRGEAARSVSRRWASDFKYNRKGWHFYQFLFTKRQMQSLLKNAGFEIRSESVIMLESGIYNTLGKPGGTYDPISGEIVLTRLGKLLRAWPGRDVGHMLCYIVDKGTYSNVG